MKTDINTLRKADWSNIERDMVLRLRVLAVAARKLDANEVTDKVAQDVFLPCLELIGAFVAAVDAEDETLDQVSVLTSHDQSFSDWWSRNRGDAWSEQNDIHATIKAAFMAGLLTMPPEVLIKSGKPAKKHADAAEALLNSVGFSVASLDDKTGDCGSL